jgi:hypothetical protein
MEKIAIQLWKKNDINEDEFKNFLVKKVPSSLADIVDKDVQAAYGLIQSSYPPSPDAIVFLKVKSLFHSEREFKVFESFSKKVFSYVVSESKIIEADESKNLNKRTEGFSQIVFLEKPKQMDRFSWFDHWTHYHTEIAIETQSNFIYTQNTVVRNLQKESPNFIAIIEECFPEGAMSDPEEFYAAKGNKELLEKNLGLMMASCEKFIDFSKIEVIPTSRYLVI